MVLLGWDSDRGVREMRRGAHGPVVIATLLALSRGSRP